MAEEKNGKNKSKISTFELQMNGEEEGSRDPMREIMNIYRVTTIDSETGLPFPCCLTCGGIKRMEWIVKVDGKKEVKRACLYCLCKIHTAQNRLDH
jgi:hypothetical protein